MTAHCLSKEQFPTALGNSNRRMPRRQMDGCPWDTSKWLRIDTHKLPQHGMPWHVNPPSHPLSLSSSVFLLRIRGSAIPQKSNVTSGINIPGLHFLTFSSRGEESVGDLQVILASQYPRTQITASSKTRGGRLVGGTWWGSEQKIMVSKKGNKNEGRN